MSSNIKMPTRGTVQHPYALTALVTAVLLGAYILLSLYPPVTDPHRLVSIIGSPLICMIGSVAMFTAAAVLWWVSRRLAIFWLVAGIAQVSLTTGEILWSVIDITSGVIPFPSPADIFYLAYYPIFLLAILSLPRTKDCRFGTLKTGLDLIIVMLSAVLFLWNYVLGPLVENGQNDPLLLKLLSLAYPVGDLMQMFAVLVLLYYLPTGANRRPFAMLAYASAVLIIADSIFSVQSLQGSYKIGDVYIDSTYFFGYLLFALAGAWQVISSRAAARAPFSTRPKQPDRLPILLYYLPYLWVAAIYILLLKSPYNSLPMNTASITLAVGIITGLVILRQIFVIQENYGLINKVQVQAKDLELANNELQIEIDERIRAEAQMTHDAMHDFLTGLPNRTYFLNRLTCASLSKRQNPEFEYSVLFLDLDSFKVVNDSMGHANGDSLLCEIARILPNCIRNTDMVARLGGDEFVILLEDMPNPEKVIQVADRIHQELSRPILLEDARIYISVSVGIVINVDPDILPENVLRDADLAMYQAKFSGKARYQIFEPSMRRRAIQRMSIEMEMRRALDQHEFRLYYQPIVRISDMQPFGFEALARWQHPERGLLSPGEFIPLAEETGLIIPLGSWILDEACQQMRQWHVDFPGLDNLTVSVNISGNQLRLANFPAEVAAALEKSALPGSGLILEITENAWIENPERINSLIRQLKVIGVECEIDDFGTGYSSMTHLRLYPINCAKIDRSFIKELDHVDSTQPSIVRGMLSLLNDLGIHSIAEGIETEAQLNTLRKMGCLYGQGYWLGYPMPAEQAVEWLAQQARVQIRA